MINLRRTMLVALTITLGACGGKNTQPIEPATEVPADSSVQTAAPTTRGGLSPQEIERRDAERRRKALLEQRTIYFDYDSTSVRREFEDQLRAHGQELRDNRNSRVRLEGHADERGSREYNIGLGERRAQEVRRLLMLSGASATQITTISYGEERPNAIGNDESAWSQNRRVELIVR